jgi:hypothetical protein
MAYDYPLSDYVGFKITPQQKRMIDIIEREFTAAGYDRPIVVAAVANSYVESSGWDPLEHTWGPLYKKTKKKTEDSAGLFQLNRMGGHGEGMPMGPQYPVGPSSKQGDSRYDPTLNTQRILEVMRRSTPFSVAQYTFGHDATKMAGEFCRIIEKPAKADEKAKEREDLVAKIFPAGWEGAPESPRDELAPMVVEGSVVVPMPLWKRLTLWGMGLGFAGIIVTAAMRQHAIKTGKFVPPSRRK